MRPAVILLLASTLARAQDPNYRALRDSTPQESYLIENLKLTRDVATLTLKTGTLTFLAPIQGRRYQAVFRGDATLDLVPELQIEKDYMAQFTGQRQASLNVQRMLVAFSDNTYEEISKSAKPTTLDAEAARVLETIRKRLRKEREDNVDANLLAAVYNPQRPPAFAAYFSGRDGDDFRFLLDPSAALPDLPPEEVALINNAGGDKNGIWYMSHLQSEWKENRASSAESKAIIDVQHYTIDSTIANNANLSATATIRITALTDGERVLHFGLEPVLRVRSVRDSTGDVPFIQEKKDEDGTLSVILPKPTTKGAELTLTLQYAGDKIITDAGGGNFFVGARTSWYPSVNAFTDRATYDLTFHYPKRYTLVGVGRLIKETKEKDSNGSQWVSDIPLAVAGFNYGEFLRKDTKDPNTGFELQAYANEIVPDILRAPPDLPGQAQSSGPGNTWSPSKLADLANSEALASIRIFERFFGPTLYKRLAITQQPAPFFGQSWPTLVYLPVISFLDSTQRWQMFSTGAFQLKDFIQEVTPHEVAHQWWGHTVGWASYHDQWLSEGFADFSASLYLQFTRKTNADFVKFYEHHRETILTKNEFGKTPNEAGPVWLGQRLDTPKNPGAYNRIVYPKGSFVLHMLRQLMWEAGKGDENFIAMMKDFVQSHQNRLASTESFKAVVEKHMTPAMDLERNRKMDWFFREWIYGTEIPRYRLEYSFAPGDKGQTMLKAKLTQSGVTNAFLMSVPIYVELNNGVARVGQMPLLGNQTREFQVPLPAKPKRVFLNANQDVLAYEASSAEIK